MLVRLTNIRLPVDEPESSLPDVILRRLKLREDDLASWRILRKSLDARKRDNLQFVYTAYADVPGIAAEQFQKLQDQHTESYLPTIFDDPEPGDQPLEERPVVVGSGPAGLLAAYYFAVKGYRPLILERGYPVKERVPVIRDFDRGGELQEENNYLFGEGGAGCFSDGKLTCRLTGADVNWVLNAFTKCGGRESIMYEHRPHLGSNKLPMICRNFRRKIDALGGEYRFGCKVERLDVQGDQIRGLETSQGYIKTRVVVLGVGHSARDTYEMLHSLGVPMQQKAFQLGLRIEQPQANVNRHKYGKPKYLDLLGAADYTMVAKGRRDLYTFCMCAGGYVMPSVSEPARFCTNGMSNSRHDSPFANSGLMITLQPEEFGSTHPLAGMELQRRFEAVAYEIGQQNYLAPIQSAQDFLAQKATLSDTRLPSSYPRGVIGADLSRVLPDSVLAGIREGLPILDKKWRGDFLKDATLVGPEMRGSAPVRMERDRFTRESPGFAGLYPVGEGAGYAGGIITAAVDGLRSAKSVVSKYAPIA